MTFRSQIGPLIKSYECFRFCLISDWKSHWTDGFLKDLNRFFFQKPRKSKNALYYQKTYDFFVKLIRKSQFLLKKSKKCNF